MSYRMNDKSMQLKEQLNKTKCIFSYEVYEYLESVLNLEVSALRQDNISSKKIEALSELKLYRDILYYNICNRALTYIDSNSIKYDIENYDKSFFISYGDIINNVSIFNVNQDENDIVNISLACSGEPTLIDITNAYVEQVEKLKEILFNTKSRFVPNNKTNLERLYSKIKDYRLEDLKIIREREIEFVQKQNNFYNKFMKDSNLDYRANVAIIGGGSFIQNVLDEDACKVYVKRERKTPIFK